MRAVTEYRQRARECRELARMVDKLEDKYALDCAAQSLGFRFVPNYLTRLVQRLAWQGPRSCLLSDGRCCRAVY
jgi:hypothetical protein